MSAAVQQGRLTGAASEVRDRWESQAPEPQTPLSPKARAWMARAEADVAKAIELRFGPRSDVAAMLGLETPVVFLEGIATVHEMAAEAIDLGRRIDALGRVA